MSIYKKVISGVSWNVLASILNQGSTFIVGIILVRLLPPSAFGLIAMAGIIVGMVSLLKDIGFSDAIIQKQSVDDELLSSIFWINIFIGFCLTFCLTFSAPLISSFFEEHTLIYLVPLVAFNFIIGSSGIVHLALLAKEMNFKQLAIINIVSTIVSGIIAIVLALNNFGVWSLALKSTFSTTISISLSWYFSQWKPKFIFNKSKVKELIKFSLDVTAIKGLRFFAEKIDDLLIGKFLGKESLGLYTKSFSFLLLPSVLVTRQFSGLLLPLFSKIQNSPLKQKKLYTKIIGIASIFICPISLGLYSVSEEFVLVVLGNRWISSIPLIEIFSLGAIFIMLSFAGVVLLSKGKSQLLLRVTFFTRLLRIISITVGLYVGGLIGAALGIVSAISINTWVMNYFVCKEIESSLQKLFFTISPFILFSIIMALIIEISEIVFLQGFTPIFKLLIMSSLGCSVYAVLLVIFKPFPYLFLSNIVSREIQNITKKGR